MNITPKAVINDTGLEFNGCKIFLLIPFKLNMPTEAVIKNFHGFLARQINSVKLDDFYKKHFELCKKLNKGEAIFN